MGWKLALDGFLNKSHQASHAPVEKTLTGNFPSLHPHREFGVRKQIVAVRGFE